MPCARSIDSRVWQYVVKACNLSLGEIFRLSTPYSKTHSWEYRTQLEHLGVRPSHLIFLFRQPRQAVVTCLVLGLDGTSVEFIVLGVMAPIRTG